MTVPLATPLVTSSFDFDTSGKRIMGRLAQNAAMMEESMGLNAAERVEIITILTEALSVALEHSFAPHTKTGETLTSKKTHIYGDFGEVTMRGGAVPVEFGTMNNGQGTFPIAPHQPPFALRWYDENGEAQFSRGHSIHGVKSDDFVGRAMDEVLLVEVATIADKIGGIVLFALLRGAI